MNRQYNNGYVCKEVKHQVLHDRNIREACQYCAYVENDADMRQIIIDAADPSAALFYCDRVSNDEDMRQIVLDSGDASVIQQYHQMVS